MRKSLIVAGMGISMLVSFGTSVSAVASTPKPKPDIQLATIANPARVAVAPSSVPVPVVSQPKHYTVVSGDSLSAIASTQGLSSWRDLWNANANISDPNLIYPGQDFVIPTGVTADRPLPVSVNPAPLDASSKSYNAQRPAVVTNPNASQGDIFARIRQRESGGNYATNTGNGYYGAYQYDLGTWGNFQGYARPDLAPPAVQDAKAQETYARRGCSPWPNTCF